MGLNHGHPKTINHGLKPWVIYKKRGFDPTPKPLRLFCFTTPLTSFAPKLRSCQNRGPWGSSPNRPLRLTSGLSRDTLLPVWWEDLVGKDIELLVEAVHDVISYFLLFHQLLQCCYWCFTGLFLCNCTLLHFDPKSDGAWISFFKPTKNHKDKFFFWKCGHKCRLSDG